MWTGDQREMAPLVVSLLGPPAVRHGAAEVRFPTRKTLALLVYLAAEPAIHSRERLISLLWPETDHDHGRTSLRASLSLLRRALGDAPGASHVEASHGGLALRATEDLQLDLRLVHDAARLAGTVPTTLAARQMATFEMAANAYRGDFAQGLDLPESPDFDEWLTVNREVWRGRIVAVLDRLSGLRADAGDLVGGLELARRWIAVDRFADPARRRLIELRLAAGDRPGALAEYEGFARLLREELGAEPEPETQALTERARRSPRPGRRGRELPLTGREAEHAALAAAFRSARSGAAAALVIGEAGLGKSRLAEDFLLWAEAHGADVLRGRGFEVGGRLPYQPIVEALRQRLRDESESDQLLPEEPWRGHLARLLPELGQAAPGDGPQDRLHLFETVSRLVGGLAASGPVVLAIDDLHWSDEGSLDMLRYAARRISAASRPFLLLGCVRSEELPMQQGLGSWAAELEREVPLTRVFLGPLDASAASSLLVAAGLPSELAERLHAESGGNPLFLVETLRDWRDQGVPPGEQPVTPGVRDAIRRRLARLDADSAEAAGAAAVLGTRFEPRLAARLLDRDEMEFLRQIEQVARLGLASPAGGDLYQFTHDRIRDAIYADLPEPRRRLLHRRAVDVLRTTGADAAQIAEQAAGGGLHAVVAEMSIRAGDAALKLFAGADAARHYRRALADPPAGQDLPDLYRKLGDALRVANRTLEAAAAYGDMLDRTRVEGDVKAEVTALNRLALAIAQSGQPGPVSPEALLARALELAGEGQARIETNTNLSLVLMYAGRWSEAFALGRDSHRACVELGLAEDGAHAASAMAQAGLFCGAWADAYQLAQEAADGYRRLGNLVLEANALSLAAGAGVRLGEAARGVDLATRAVALSEQLDNSWGLATALLHLAEARLELDEPDAVLQLAERGLEAATDSGFRPLIAYSHLLTGLALLDLDEPRRAELSFTAGLEAAAGSPARVLEEVCLSGLGAMKLMAGDVAGAVRLVLDAVDRRSETSPFCIAFRAWDVASLALGGRHAEAAADLAALERVVGGFQSGRRVVERGRAAAAAASLREVLQILRSA
jgi:DNA-binding SARP family transcriptional activator